MQRFGDEIFQVESGIQKVENGEFDDDGKPKRTGEIKIEFKSLFACFLEFYFFGGNYLEIKKQ